jgi:hypothetical protein
MGQADDGRAAARGRQSDELGAASYDYLFYSGYVVLAYWWARSVAAADASAHGAAFAQGKRETARSTSPACCRAPSATPPRSRPAPRR